MCVTGCVCVCVCVCDCMGCETGVCEQDRERLILFTQLSGGLDNHTYSAGFTKTKHKLTSPDNVTMCYSALHCEPLCGILLAPAHTCSRAILGECDMHCL